MAVIVTRKAGGVSQLFNTDTGRVTYKCKSDSALMLVEAFGGIVKFNKKGATATITGDIKTLDSCDVIKEDTLEYKDALKRIIQSLKEFTKEKNEIAQQEIAKLESKLSSL